MRCPECQGVIPTDERYIIEACPGGKVYFHPYCYEELLKRREHYVEVLG